ncbi:phosphatase PAP2 family protein [Pseudoalteromonas xiamenensis]
MKGANSSKCAWLQRADVIGCLLCIVVFVQFPILDIVVSSWFFRDGHFFLANNDLVQVIYWTFAKIHYVLLLGFVCVFVRYFWVDKKNELRECRLKQLKIMTIALVFVPGILVNTIIKDNSLGRARPHQIEQFSGRNTFLQRLLILANVVAIVLLSVGMPPLGFILCCLAGCLVAAAGGS